MTTTQLITSAAKAEAEACRKSSADPKNSHTVQQVFWFQALHWDSFAKQIEKIVHENPSPEG